MILSMNAADVVAATLAAALLPGRGMRTSGEAVGLFLEVRAALGVSNTAPAQGGVSAPQTPTASAP